MQATKSCNFSRSRHTVASSTLQHLSVFYAASENQYSAKQSHWPRTGIVPAYVPMYLPLGDCIEFLLHNKITVSTILEQEIDIYWTAFNHKINLFSIILEKEFEIYWTKFNHRKLVLLWFYSNGQINSQKDYIITWRLYLFKLMLLKRVFNFKRFLIINITGMWILQNAYITFGNYFLDHDKR